MKPKEWIRSTLLYGGYICLILFIIYYVVTTFCFHLLHPDFSSMQVFLHTPRTLILDWNTEADHEPED